MCGYCCLFRCWLRLLVWVLGCFGLGCFGGGCYDRLCVLGLFWVVGLVCVIGVVLCGCLLD